VSKEPCINPEKTSSYLKRNLQKRYLRCWKGATVGVCMASRLAARVMTLGVGAARALCVAACCSVLQCVAVC